MVDFVRSIPDGDNRERLVCADCGHVAYENPKLVVGTVIVHGGEVLLCRRAIEPSRGLWTLPAGYLEMGETPEEGAAREAAEEAGASITLDGLLGVFSISRIGQVQLIYRGRFAEPATKPLFFAGEETLEAALFAWEDIPWKALAFPSVRWALEAWRASGVARLGAPSTNPAEDRRGIAPLATGRVVTSP